MTTVAASNRAGTSSFLDGPARADTRRTRGSVHVVVPCYNYGRFLETCVRSVLDQTDVELDVAIIDDCSGDDTAEIATRLAAVDPRVGFTRHATRRGHVATFNEGLGATRADYVVLLSADDALAPGALARAARFLDDEPGVGFVYGHAAYFAEEPLPPARQDRSVRRIRNGTDWIARRCRSGTNCISSPEVMMRTATLEAVGPFDPALPITGDLELWLRFAAHADVGYLAHCDQAFYRRHAESMYRSGHEVVTDLEFRRDAFEHFFTGAGATIPDAPRHEADARIALASEALWRACRAYDRGRVQRTPVEPLEEFATTTWPDAADLRYARALRRRVRLGEATCRALQPLGWYAIGHHLAERSRTRRWARTGDL